MILYPLVLLLQQMELRFFKIYFDATGDATTYSSSTGDAVSTYPAPQLVIALKEVVASNSNGAEDVVPPKHIM